MSEESGHVSNQGLALILAVLRKNRDRNILVCLLLAVCCGTWLWSRLSLPAAIWEGGNLLLAGGVIAAFGFAGMERLRGETNREDFIRLLTKSPDSLVWVYYLKVDIQPFGVHVRQTATLFFWTDRQTHISLRASEQESIAIMNALRNSLAHTSFGYSLQKEQLYRADPALLKR